MMAFAFVLTMLLLPLEATEPSAQEAFDKGCELYLAGEYQRAVDVYVEGKVLDENPGLYYYNLGICAFRMDRYGSALACFLQARHFMPRDGRTKHNIAVTRSRLGLESDRSFVESMRDALLLVTAKESLILSALLASLAFFLWAFYYMRKHRSLHRVAAGTFAAAVLLCAIGLYMTLGLGAPLGVVTRASPAYSDPTTAGGEIRFTVHEGEELRVEEILDHWILVQDRAGQEGWVPKESIAVLQ